MRSREVCGFTDPNGELKARNTVSGGPANKRHENEYIRASSKYDERNYSQRIRARRLNSRRNRERRNDRRFTATLGFDNVEIARLRYWKREPWKVSRIGYFHYRKIMTDGNFAAKNHELS